MASQARNLITESLPEGGLLVIDPEAGRSHTLNAAAAAAWKAWSEGSREVSDIAARIASTTPLPADDGIAHAALAQLKDAGLVSEEIPVPPLQQVARRRLLQLAAAAALALPLIETIVTPSPAHAQSAPPPSPGPPAPPPSPGPAPGPAPGANPGSLRRPQR